MERHLVGMATSALVTSERLRRWSRPDPRPTITRVTPPPAPVRLSRRRGACVSGVGPYLDHVELSNAILLHAHGHGDAILLYQHGCCGLGVYPERWVWKRLLRRLRYANSMFKGRESLLSFPERGDTRVGFSFLPRSRSRGS